MLGDEDSEWRTKTTCQQVKKEGMKSKENEGKVSVNLAV